MMLKPSALRRQANRALRLARAVSDERAAQALSIHATDLFAQAERLERGHMALPTPDPEQQRPAQQQHQIQPSSDDEKE